jgi:aspartate/methionine/tyrosine aminotransferase
MTTRQRAMQSEYMHWAKNQPAVRFHLGSSEVANYALEQLPFTLADLELDGASRHRYLPLRQAVGDRYGVPAECVVTADGTSMANMLAMTAIIAPGDEVLIEQPTYEPLVAVASFLGANINRFERRSESGFRLDPSAVERAMTPRTRLIVLTNLHNPSGVLTDETALRAIGELAARSDALVLIDEVYLDSAAAPARSAIHLGEQFVCTNSLTKVYGLSGIRCGWILAAPPLAERLWRLNELFGVAQAHAAEQLGCIAFAHLDEIAAQTPALLARNRALYNSFLSARDDLDGIPMMDGITTFPRWRGRDVKRLSELLRAEYDTSIVPGHWFDLPDHFRVGVGSPTEIVQEGLARLGAALDRLR